MKYEYKIVNVDASGSWGHVEEEEILKIMHDLAKKDWEFVSATPLATFSLFRQRGTTSTVFLFFKRPKKSSITKKLKE